MKTGLVLEGGAMRGMYTAGALDVLLENDINFDGIIGTSAGAVFGVNFLSRQDGRVIRYNCRFNGDRNYMGIKPLLKSGDFFNTEYAYYKVPNELDIFDDETYQKSGVPFYATVTDVKTGKPEYLQVKSVLRDMEMLRASASMPFISKPVIIGGRAYLDGGISDSIPFEHFSEFPNLCNALENRHNVYNESIDKLCELEQSGKVFIIRPSEPITISRTERDPDRLKSVYELGRKDMEIYLEGLEEFLEKEQGI